MRAVCWNGKKDVRVETVPDPEIINPRDAITKTELTAICRSDLHLYSGNIPTMKAGDILGHEFLGEVVELGRGVSNLQTGDRVIVPFPIACGNCYYCAHELFSFCDNSNPNGGLTEPFYGPTGRRHGDRRKTDNHRPTFRPLAEARRETPALARKRNAPRSRLVHQGSLFDGKRNDA